MLDFQKRKGKRGRYQSNLVVQMDPVYFGWFDGNWEQRRYDSMRLYWTVSVELFLKNCG